MGRLQRWLLTLLLLLICRQRAAQRRQCRALQLSASPVVIVTRHAVTIDVVVARCHSCRCRHHRQLCRPYRRRHRRRRRIPSPVTPLPSLSSSPIAIIVNFVARRAGAIVVVSRHHRRRRRIPLRRRKSRRRHRCRCRHSRCRRHHHQLHCTLRRCHFRRRRHRQLSPMSSWHTVNLFFMSRPRSMGSSRPQWMGSISIPVGQLSRPRLMSSISIPVSISQ